MDRFLQMFDENGVNPSVRTVEAARYLENRVSSLFLNIYIFANGGIQNEKNLFDLFRNYFSNFSFRM